VGGSSRTSAASAGFVFSYRTFALALLVFEAHGKSTLRWWRRNGRDRVDPDPLPRLTHPVSVEHVLPIGKDHLTLNGRRRGY